MADWQRHLRQLKLSQARRVVPVPRRAEIRAERQLALDNARLELARDLPRVIRTELADCGLPSGGALRTDVVQQRMWAFVHGVRREVLPTLLAVQRQAGVTDFAARVRLAEHCWCELIARAIDQLVTDGGWRSEGMTTIVHAVGESASDGLFAVVVQPAVEGVWSRVRELTNIGEPYGSVRTLLALRLLGVFLCKAPESHATVVRSCFVRLLSHLSSTTQEECGEALVSAR